MTLYRNRNCPLNFYIDLSILKDTNQSNLLNKCAKNMDNFILTEIIGSGSSGTVWSGSCIFKEISKKRKRTQIDNVIEIAVKISIVSKDLFEKSFLEVDFNYYMSEIGLGPKIYDAFFIQDPKRSLYISQFIIMEPFDFNCSVALKNSTFNEKTIIVHKMINLLKSSIFDHDIFCSDIKPSNFVLKKLPNGDIIVKMIDFDAKYCLIKSEDLFYGHRFPLDLKKNVFYFIELLQLYLFIDDPLKDLFNFKGLKNYGDIIIDFIYNIKEPDIKQFLHYHPNFTKKMMIDLFRRTL